MSTKAVIQALEEYQKARLGFACSCAELASKPGLVDCLLGQGVVDLLSPLLVDPLARVQQCAALALGRLVSARQEAAADVSVKQDIIIQLLKNFDSRSKQYKKNAMLLLQGLSKQSAERAGTVCRLGGLEAALTCLEDFDLGVKEAGALVIGSIARHNEKMASYVTQTGAVGLLKMCLQESDLCLKQVSIQALTDIARQSAELARVLIDNGCLTLMVKNLACNESKLKKNLLCCLSHIVSHSVDLAETVVEADAFPSALYHLAHPDPTVRRAAALLTREVTKHNVDLAGLVVNSGGTAALLEALNCSDNSVKLPTLMALGYIAAHSELLAMAIIKSQGVPMIASVLKTEVDEGVVSVAVWALGHIGRHSSEHTQHLAEAGVYSDIIRWYCNETVSEDLKQKCKNTCKLVLQKCTFSPALEAILFEAPADIIKYILGQFVKILAIDSAARRKFITSGCLEKVQKLHPTPGTTLFEYITLINYCFPEEIVRYYSPGYSESLLEQVEQYSPQIPPLFAQSLQVDPQDDTEMSFSLPKDEC